MFSAAPGHNAEFYRFWIKADEMFSRLLFKNLDLYPFTGDFVATSIPAAVKIACRVRYFLIEPTADAAKYEALALGELLAPVLSNDKFLAENLAQEELVRIVRYLITNPTCDAAYYAAPIWGNWLAFLREAQQVDNVPREWRTLAAPPTDAMVDNLDPATAAILLAWIGMRSPLSTMANSVEMITTTILALVKQGNVTAQVTNKVQNDIANELGQNINIDQTVVRMFHSQFSQSVTEQNIGGIFNSWTAWIPVVALRLTLLVQQAAMSGLTSFCTTGKAIRVYDDFPWHQVAYVLPVEWAAFGAAMNAVGGNVYYGFARDLGAAKSTNYKSVTWVAKELLIRLGGFSSLSKYKGWIRRPQNFDVLEEMVNTYVEGKTAQMQNVRNLPQPPPDNVITAATAAANANIFA